MWKCGWMGELNVDADVNGGGGVVREDTGISGTWECGTPNRASKVGGGDEGGAVRGSAFRASTMRHLNFTWSQRRVHDD